MAKKRSSRSRSSRRGRSTRAEKPQMSQPTSSGPANLSEEYEYVLTDLRRIGILAVILVAFLVGLSFFL